MKKLLYITLIFACIGGIQNQSQAWIGEGITDALVEDKQGPNYVTIRMDKMSMDLWVVFYGPQHKAGDQVDVKVFNSNGELVQQDFLVGNGGNKAQILSMDGLEPGTYAVEITGNIYNLNDTFTLE